VNRLVFETHYRHAAFRYCPICQYGIDQQHEEALAQNSEAGFAIVQAEAEDDRVRCEAEASAAVH
jgi:hypothetical protein